MIQEISSSYIYAEGNTALHLASANGHVEVVEFLLRQGADVDGQNSKGLTALHVASVTGGKGRVVDVLMRYGASVSVVDDLGMVPASYAAMFGHVKVIETLMKKNDQLQQQKVNTIKRNGMMYSPLHMACLGGDAVVVKLILELEKTRRSNGEYCLVNDCNNNIRVSPLHCAALSGNVEIVKVLLSLGSETSAQDAEGCTPLDHHHAAAVVDDDDIIASLLETSGTCRNNSEGINIQHEGEKRRSKIQGWIRMAGSELESLLGEYDDRVRESIIPILLKAKELQVQIDVHSAYSALRADSEFQEDMRDSETARIVDLLRKDTSQYEYYMHQPKIGSVLVKLQRLHGNLKCLGQSTLVLDAVLVKKEDQEGAAMAKESDAMKKKALLEQLDACVSTIDRILVGKDNHEKGEQQGAEYSIMHDDDDVRFKDILLRNGIMLLLVTILALVFKYYYLFT